MIRKWLEMLRNVSMDDEDAAVEDIAQHVVKEGMSTAAILFLETSKPVSFLAGQAALIATPFVGGFLDPMRMERYSDLFSDRRFIERLIQRIEELEAERAGKHAPQHE